MADTPSKLPSFVAWPSFPFEGQLRTKRLEGPVPIEPAREGEDPSECTACTSPDEAYVWVSDRWRVRAMDRPSGLPMVLVLEARSHLDLGDLPNLLAAELGVMTVRLERAVRSLDGVERVHVNRWGDNAAHLHLWFLARPTGYLQLRGSFLSMWDDILEPVAEDVWRENLALVAAWLADFGGRAIAEPPRIEWHAPSHFEDHTAGRAGEPSASSSGPSAPSQPVTSLTHPRLPGASTLPQSTQFVANAGSVVPAPAGQPAVEGLTNGAIAGNGALSPNTVAAPNGAAALTGANVPTGAAIPNGATAPNGAASLNGAFPYHGTSSHHGTAPLNGTSSPNGMPLGGIADVDAPAPTFGPVSNAGAALGISISAALGLTPAISGSGSAELTGPVGSGSAIAQAPDTKTLPGSGRTGAPSEAAGIDGEGWGLSPEEIAESDILSR